MIQKYCKYTLTIVLLFLFITLNAQDLVINEFMASNDSLSGIIDEFGETDDWVELHNRTNNAIDISGYGLSDDYSLLDKWIFPSGIIIPANGYLIVWTDKDDIQGDLHTSFKLNSSGERIVLSSDMGILLDSISYEEQETNVSMARIPNGNGPFIQQAPTFNSNNEPTITSNIETPSFFKLFPSLTTGDLFLENSLESTKNCLIQIYQLNGQLVHSQNEVMTPFATENINVANLKNGHYLLLLRMKNRKTQSFYFQKN